MSRAMILAPLLFVGGIAFSAYSQKVANPDDEQVKLVIDRFFESLEKQDTLLMKEVVYPDGQIWRLNYRGDTLRSSIRTFRDIFTTFRAGEVLKETAISVDIRIHNALAMAWVPYEFRVNGTFSHCGVDAFTLTKKEGRWKIITLAYTIENQGCDKLKE